MLFWIVSSVVPLSQAVATSTVYELFDRHASGASPFAGTLDLRGLIDWSSSDAAIQNPNDLLARLNFLPDSTMVYDDHGTRNNVADDTLTIHAELSYTHYPAPAGLLEPETALGQAVLDITFRNTTVAAYVGDDLIFANIDGSLQSTGILTLSTGPLSQFGSIGVVGGTVQEAVISNKFSIYQPTLNNPGYEGRLGQYFSTDNYLCFENSTCVGGLIFGSLGLSLNGVGFRANSASEVPEPSTGALITAGMLGLARRRRRFR